MKVILVNGSPHKTGCTNRALEEVAKTLNAEGIDTEIFWLSAKPVGGCTACFKCIETGKCVFHDCVNEFREKAYGADEVEEDGEGLYNMRVLGRNMAYFLKCKEAAKKLGVELPKFEPPVFTNFVRRENGSR